MSVNSNTPSVGLIMHVRNSLIAVLFVFAVDVHASGGKANVSITPHGAQKADYSVEIVNGEDADETWNVTGACSEEPDEVVHFYEGYEIYPADKTVRIVTGLSADSADREVCIYLPSMLSHELRKRLGLL